MSRAPRLLVVTHAAWEGPGRILEAFRGWETLAVRPLAGEALPEVGAVDAAVFMGGPMNVDETAAHPGLAAEREWLAMAHAADLPLLGVCLGAQLLARALGATVRSGEAPEIGFAPVTVIDPEDPVLGPLAPTTTVLHWHGDVLALPPGTRHLARSAATEVQAFRAGRAWGLLFHAEADEALVAEWLTEPTMVAAARAAHGAGTEARLRADAIRHGAELRKRSGETFAAFAAIAAPGLRGCSGARTMGRP